MDTVKENYRFTKQEADRRDKAMELVGMTNKSEFMRDAMRRRCEQIEKDNIKKGRAGFMR